MTTGDAQGATNRVRGRLAGVAHLGDVVQRVVVTSSGVEVLARAPRGAAGPGTSEVGAEVWCGFAPENVHVFPAPLTPGSPA